MLYVQGLSISARKPTNNQFEIMFIFVILFTIFTQHYHIKQNHCYVHFISELCSVKKALFNIYWIELWQRRRRGVRKERLIFKKELYIWKWNLLLTGHIYVTKFP